MNNNDPLKGLCFVFTGELSIDRSDAQARVIMLGGRVTINPSSKTDYLVVGKEPGPSKTRKAADLNIKILDEQEFLKMLEKHEKDRFKPTIENRIDIPAEKSNEQINTEKNTMKLDTDTQFLWSEKYRPNKESDFVGNRFNIAKLRDFLSGKTEKNAVLLSGHPGIGKTTAALFVCKEMGFDVIEMNASDVRNKGSLQKHVKGLLSSGCLGRDMKIGRRVLVMDEVDGMTSDRGGIEELVGIIKTAPVPIICICNDRTNTKIRTLSNHCVDLRFRKLEDRQILPRIVAILHKEGRMLKEPMLKEIVHQSNGDIRYILNTLQSLFMKNFVTPLDVANVPKKTQQRGLWECVADIFSRKSVADKIEIYFEDYEMIPLMVHENYIKARVPLNKLLEAAEAISVSDLIENRLRSNQDWNLLPSHAVFSTVIPGISMSQRIDFTRYLGFLSKTNANQRNMGLAVLNSPFLLSSSEFRRDVLDFVYFYFNHLMRSKDADGAIKLLVKLNLLDYENLWKILDYAVADIDRGTKAAFTRGMKKNTDFDTVDIDRSKRVKK